VKARPPIAKTDRASLTARPQRMQRKPGTCQQDNVKLTVAFVALLENHRLKSLRSTSLILSWRHPPRRLRLRTSRRSQSQQRTRVTIVTRALCRMSFCRQTTDEKAAIERHDRNCVGIRASSSTICLSNPLDTVPRHASKGCTRHRRGTHACLWGFKQTRRQTRRLSLRSAWSVMHYQVTPRATLAHDSGRPLTVDSPPPPPPP
jgi:hypothetical protein